MGSNKIILIVCGGKQNSVLTIDADQITDAIRFLQKVHMELYRKFNRFAGSSGSDVRSFLMVNKFSVFYSYSSVVCAGFFVGLMSTAKELYAENFLCSYQVF